MKTSGLVSARSIVCVLFRDLCEVMRTIQRIFSLDHPSPRSEEKL